MFLTESDDAFLWSHLKPLVGLDWYEAISLPPLAKYRFEVSILALRQWERGRVMPHVPRSDGAFEQREDARLLKELYDKNPTVVGRLVDGLFYRCTELPDSFRPPERAILQEMANRQYHRKNCTALEPRLTTPRKRRKRLLDDI